MQPTFFDYGILFIVVASALVGLFRGLIREILALAGWLFAAWVAYTFSGVAAGWMPESLPGGPVARTVLGFVLLFVVTVIGTSLVGALLSAVLERAGLKPADRGLGMVFGLARGGVIILVLMTVAGFTSVPEQPFWRDAVTRPYAEEGGRAANPLLPPHLPKKKHNI
ncbi:CvpA family protein, partial [Ralstonia solanacearum]|uniref:CvpA family protein n=1 Tax=Ralstonia solanacearum TaxID=305 RepID=UPI002366D9C0